MFLDLSVCQRCQGADENLDAAVSEVTSVLETAGYEIIVNKINITSKELAVKHEFRSSPTIRVNGVDIMDEVHESGCCDCGSLCGKSVDCRVFDHEGKQYTSPPKTMIVNAILKTVYAGAPAKRHAPYVLPENLKEFFDRLEAGRAGS